MNKKPTLVFILFMLLFWSSANGQLTANQLLETEFIKILQSDGILLKDGEKKCTGDCRNINLWKNDNKRKKWIEKDDKLKSRLLNKFAVPSFFAIQN